MECEGYGSILIRSLITRYRGNTPLFSHTPHSLIWLGRSLRCSNIPLSLSLSLPRALSHDCAHSCALFSLCTSLLPPTALSLFLPPAIIPFSLVSSPSSTLSGLMCCNLEPHWFQFITPLSPPPQSPVRVNGASGYNKTEDEGPICVPFMLRQPWCSAYGQIHLHYINKHQGRIGT